MPFGHGIGGDPVNGGRASQGDEIRSRETNNSTAFRVVDELLRLAVLTGLLMWVRKAGWVILPPALERQSEWVVLACIVAFSAASRVLYALIKLPLKWWKSRKLRTRQRMHDDGY